MGGERQEPAEHPSSSTRDSKNGVGGFVKRRVGAGALLRRLDELSAAVADVSIASTEPSPTARPSRSVSCEFESVPRRSCHLKCAARKLKALEAELDAFEQGSPKPSAEPNEKLAILLIGRPIGVVPRSRRGVPEVWCRPVV